jgi:ATP-binding cassette, subfamily B, bacterial CvaB/MchF/RaxB
MISSAYGLQIDLRELRRKFPISSRGANLKDLVSYAAQLNLGGRAVRLEIEEMSSLKVPCILHWDMQHFVVLKKVNASGVTILDPSVGEVKLTYKQLAKHFTGVALELLPTAEFEAEDLKQKISFKSLTGRIFGLKTALFQIFFLAILLQGLALTGPLLNQFIVDDAIATGDTDLMTVVIIGFVLLLVVQTLISIARSWMVIVLGQSVSLQWASNVFSHLVKLPASYFERRHLGDLVSRFGSVSAIQRTLTTSIVEAILDGIMGIAALGMMLMYSLKLAAITVSAVTIYALLRWASYQPFRQAAAERLTLSARENSNFLETLRAIIPLKLYGKSEDRRVRWQNLLVEVQNRDVKTAQMNLGFATANSFIFGIENLLIFWFGANMVMQTSMSGGKLSATTLPFSIGMLFAYMAYKGQFTGRVSALINYIVDLKMLNLHAERLGDIVLTAPEVDDVPFNDLLHLTPEIELRNVSFRYGEGEQWILKNANLVIKAGTSSALVGPSGCGKTTLLKVVLGILQPQEGLVLYGGVPVKSLGIGNYRRILGTVMQEDTLLAGSIAENISFFEVDVDQERVMEAAKLASIHDEVSKMPMSYHTLTGDMGSTLSGGQKQRILLARALYKRPQLLALDEATSHLDITNERLVSTSLKSMNVTRFIIAHRPETIASVERVIQLKDGEVKDVTPPEIFSTSAAQYFQRI